MSASRADSQRSSCTLPFADSSSACSSGRPAASGTSLQQGRGAGGVCQTVAPLRQPAPQGRERLTRLARLLRSATQLRPVPHLRTSAPPGALAALRAPAAGRPAQARSPLQLAKRRCKHGVVGRQRHGHLLRPADPRLLKRRHGHLCDGKQQAVAGPVTTGWCQRTAQSLA